MDYITDLKDEYPIDFFGLRDGKQPTDGMLYFVERRYFNKPWLPIKCNDTVPYMVVNGKWVRGKEREDAPV